MKPIVPLLLFAIALMIGAYFAITYDSHTPFGQLEETQYPAVKPGVFKERTTSVEFPLTTSFSSHGQAYTLQATGAALRRKWFVDGYTIASYIANPIRGDQDVVLADIFQSDKAKQLTIHWMHLLPLQLVREGYAESLHKVLNDQEYNRLKPDIDKYLSWYTADAKVGDIFVLKWLPGGYLELDLNDKLVGNMVSPELAKALWSIWLGPDSVVDRKQLIGLVSTNR